jgi:hypothetical protein
MNIFIFTQSLVSASLPSTSTSTLMSSATSFSLPNQVSLYVASRALFIRPNYHPRLPANDLLVRIEWSQQPTLALIRDQQTIQDELSQPDTLKIQLAGLVGLIQLFQGQPKKKKERKPPREHFSVWTDIFFLKKINK